MRRICLAALMLTGYAGYRSAGVERDAAAEWN